MNQKLTEEERAAIHEWIGDRPIVDLVHGLKGDIEHFQAKHAKARQRIVELEAQVTASETVSRAEYDTMVKQRDTLREELKAARHLLVETLPWLRTYDEEADELSWLIDAIEALQPFRA